MDYENYEMEYEKLKYLDKKISRIVLGTMIVNLEEREKSFSLLDNAFDLGCNTLDTAHVYGGGDSERLIGEWMQERDNREEMVIISKGAHPNADRKKVTPFDISADLHDSLARLQTDYIDIYLLHRDDPSVTVGPIMERLNKHLEEGKIKAYGGSNWGYERIRKANKYAEENELVPMVASSPHFSLAEQVANPWGPGCVSLTGSDKKKARKWYQDNQMPIFAYSSLSRGFFSGKITTDNYSEIKDSIDAVCKKAYWSQDNLERLRRVEIISEEKGYTVPQIALSYVLNKNLNVFPLVGAASLKEIKENIQALNINLTSEELAWLNLEEK